VEARVVLEQVGDCVEAEYIGAFARLLRQLQPLGETGRPRRRAERRA